MDKNSAHKNNRSEYNKKWYQENKDKVKQWRLDNKEKISKRQKEWRKNNPERSKELWDQWYKNNKIRTPKRRFTEAKRTAKRRNIYWNLTLEEYSFLINMPCYYCNNLLCDPVVRSIGLDRLNSNIGYELNNVVSCGYACNVIKHTFLTPEEMKLVASTIIDFRKSGVFLEKP